MSVALISHGCLNTVSLKYKRDDVADISTTDVCNGNACETILQNGHNLVGKIKLFQHKPESKQFMKMLRIPSDVPSLFTRD